MPSAAIRACGCGHMPFAIGQAERDAWMRHMLAALATLDLADDTRAAMERYFDDASTFLKNAGEVRLLQR
jgi:hemoglobin